MSPPCTPHRVVARAASGALEAKEDAGGGGGGGGGGRGRANAGECRRMRATASRRLISVQRSATVDVASAINHIIARHCQRAAGGLLFGTCAAAQASECFVGVKSEGSPFFICAHLLFRETSPTGSRPSGLIGHHQRQQETTHSKRCLLLWFTKNNDGPRSNTNGKILFQASSSHSTGATSYATGN